MNSNKDPAARKRSALLVFRDLRVVSLFIYLFIFPRRTSSPPINLTRLIFVLMMTLFSFYITMNSSTSFLSNSSSSTSQVDSYGVRLTTRPVTATSNRIGYQGNHSDSDKSVQEHGWTLSNMLERFSFKDTYPWRSTDISHTVLARLRVPQDLVVNSLTSAPFNSFIFWRGDVEVQLQATATPFHQGLAMAVFVPLTPDSTFNSNILPNFSSLSVNQCVYLYANANTSAVMTIPFNSMQHYLDLTKSSDVSVENSLGFLYIIVFNQLQLSAAASDTATISLFSRFLNNQFKVPRLSSPTLIGVAQADGTRTPFSSLICHSDDLVKLDSVSKSNNPLVFSGPYPFPSSFYSDPDSVFYHFYTIERTSPSFCIYHFDHYPSLLCPHRELVGVAQAGGKPAETPPAKRNNLLSVIADTILPGKMVGDAIDMAAGLVSTFLDKPTNPSLALPSVVTGTSRMNFCQGEEAIDKLSVIPSQVFTSTSETFATDNDEMSFDYLKRKMTYLGSFNLSTLNQPGSVVGSFPINPTPVEMFNGARAQVPLISLLSFPFCFYRGGFTYLLQIVATSLQTAKLFAAINFGQYAPPAAIDINSITSQYGQAFEINQGSNQIEFSVPYVSTTPYKRVPTSNDPSESDTLGYINFVVLNSLVAPNNTPTSITINVFIAGGDDFELSTLSSGNNVVTSDLPPVQSRNGFELVGRAQAGDDSIPPLNSTTAEVDMAHEDLISPSVMAPLVREPIAQTEILSVKDVLKKYQMFPRFLNTSISNTLGGSFLIYRLSDIFGCGQIATTFTNPALAAAIPGLFSHFTPLFRLFKGGLRFKLMINNVDNVDFTTFSVFYEPPTQFVVSPPTDQLNSYRNSMYTTSQVANTYNANTGPNKAKNLTRLPVSYINSIQRTAEFEVPFSSIYASVISRMGNFSENYANTSPTSNLGCIVIYTTGDTNASSSYPIDFFVSFSDESRLGTLYHVPTVVVNCRVDPVTGAPVSSSYPDNYGTGSPISNTLFRL
jgi:hypothetical protein